MKSYIVDFKGNSMFPTIRHGWKIHISPAIKTRIIPGDIAVFYRQNLICHRLVGFFRDGDGSYFLEKGDWRGCSINKISLNKIVGIVDKIETSEGLLLDRSYFAGFLIRFKCAFITIIYNVLRFIKRKVFKGRRSSLASAAYYLLVKLSAYLL